MTDKQELRRMFRQRRRDAKDVAPAIQEAVLALIESCSPNQVGLYSALPGEVDLFSLRQRIAAPVALPRADGEGRLEYLSCCGTTLEPDGCQIPAPSTGNPLRPKQQAELLWPQRSARGRGGNLTSIRLQCGPATAQVLQSSFTISPRKSHRGGNALPKAEEIHFPRES